MPYLRATRRVIAFDVAGFGLTPPLPKRATPTLPNLVDALERSLREMGVSTPLDMAGNSLGGGMVLEAARRGISRSVVAISPIGLWRKQEPAHVKYVFGGMRFMASKLPRVMKATLRVPLLRELALAIPVSQETRRIPASVALQAVADLAKSSAFEETLKNTRSPFSGKDIATSLTVAFGGRDWILLKSSRRRDTLPEHTNWVEKRKWGHVPMWTDPAGVAELILQGTT